MAQWKSVDQANGAPIVAGLPDTTANGETLYQNSTPGAFVNNQTVGVFGVDAAEMAVAGFGKSVAHPGWQLVKRGTGPVTAVAATGGTSYANTDLVVISGGQINGAGTLVTNSTGGTLVITVTNGGRGFMNVGSVTVAITNSTGGATGGSGATFVPTLGGRAGRVQTECLVAMNLTGDGEDTIFPDS